jgi:hypothetical protein
MNAGRFPIGSDDDEGTLRAFVEQTGVTFPIALAADDHYQQFIRGPEESPFPLDVVVGPEGRVVHMAHDYDAERLRTVLDALTR